MDVMDGLQQFKLVLDIFKGLGLGGGSKEAFSSPPQTPKDILVPLEQLTKMQSLIMSTQEAYATLLDHKGEMEKKIAQLEDWAEEKKRYELRMAKSSEGVFPVYRLRDAFTLAGEEPHQICAECYKNGKKSELSQVPAFFDGLRQNLVRLMCGVHDAVGIVDSRHL